MGRKRREVPWLDQRDNGIWYVFWYDEAAKQTRRESMETRDTGEATRRFAEFLSRGPKSTLHVGDAGITVDQILTWYDVGIAGQIIGHIQENVVDKERQRFAIANLRRGFAGVLARNADVAATEKYAAERRAGEHGNGRAASDATIRRELGVLVSAARFCLKRKLLPPEQMPVVEKPKEPERKAPWLTKESIRTIFEHASPRMRAWARITYYSAARRRAVERMKISQIDLEHGRVDLHSPGKKRTKKRNAIVPLYPEMRRDIETLLLETTTDYLFDNPTDFYWEFARFCEKHDIKAMDMPEGTTPWPHLLRHSRATHMLMDGEDIYKVAKLLGDTVTTVERVYGHHQPEYLATTSTAEAV